MDWELMSILFIHSFNVELLLKTIEKYLLVLRDLALLIPFNISIGCKNTFQIPATLGRHSYFADYLNY